jgi:16S rRNA processing protein RimM
MQQEAMIAIGRFTKPHGLRGELVFLPYVYDVALLPDLTNLQICVRQGAEHPQEHRIVAWRAAPKRVLIRLEGCLDMAQAEALREAEVLIPRRCFPPLPAEEYYWFEIEGLAVYASDGRYLGTVADIIYTGSNDVYVVRHGAHELLIPALKDVVRTIDLDHGAMHLFPVPDLLE